MLPITATVPLLFPAWRIPFCDSFLKHSLLTNFENKRYKKGRCMKGSSYLLPEAGGMCFRLAQ